MKLLTISSFIISLMIMFLACNKNFDHPLIQTGEVTDIDSSGAVFHGKIMKLGSEDITDYGFVWSSAGEPVVDKNHIKSLGIPEKSGVFSARVMSAFAEGKTYYVRSYIVSSETVVYGRSVSFVSLGSKAPRIYEFSPDTATWGDTITITGENFSYKNGENLVFFGDHYAEPISSDDRTIITTVPYTLDFSPEDLSVSIIGNISKAEQKFTLTYPVIEGFNPNKGTYGDLIEITGQYFHPLFTSVKFDSLEAVIQSINANTVRVLVPGGLPPENVDLTVLVAGQEVTAETQFESTSPDIADFYPKSATFEDEITIEGRNFSDTPSENIVKFGDKLATVIQADENILKVSVPTSLNADTCKISVEIKEQTAFTDTKFTLLSAIINSFSPMQSTFGDEITIAGNYFSTDKGKNIVKFGNTTATVKHASRTQLKVLVPNDLGTEAAKISVQVFTKTGYSEELFTLFKPVITSFSPQTGTFGDEITIQGDYFNPVLGNNVVKFGTKEATVTEVTKNMLKVIVPNNYYSASGKTNISVKIGNLSCVSENKFELLLHTITSIDPLYGSRGDKITITGNNFNPDAQLNYVYIGGIQATVVSGNSNSLKIIVPNGLDHGTHDLKISIAGRQIIGSEQFMIYEPWTQISDYPGGPRFNTFSFTLNGKAYVGGGLLGGYNTEKYDFWEYDPEIDNWLRKNDIPEAIEYKCQVFTTDSYAYAIRNRQLWHYDPSTDQWTRKADYPGQAKWGYATFSIRDIGYVGTGIDKVYKNKWDYKPTSDVWRYSESTNTWERIADYGAGDLSAGIGFSIDDTGYIGLGWGNSTIWEYDPTTDVWTETLRLVNNFDFYAGRAGGAVVVVEGKAYFIAGSNSADVYKDIYVFDPKTNTFVKLPDMPAHARTYITAFELNNKIYVGTGVTEFSDGTALRDFWKFDPAKLKPTKQHEK